jgi:hypothetical protein
MNSKYNTGRLVASVLIGFSCLLILFSFHLYSKELINGALLLAATFGAVVSIGFTQLMIAIFDVGDNTRKILDFLTDGKKVDEQPAEVEGILFGNQLIIKEQVPVAKSKKTTKNKTVSCNRCNTSNETDNVFCIKCGEELEEK